MPPSQSEAPAQADPTAALTPAPAFSGGMVAEPAKPSGNKGLIIGSVVFFLLLGLGAAYIWILPGIADSKYLSAVTPALSAQQDKMKAAFATFTTPVFASTQETLPAQDAKELAAARTAIEDAQKATQALSGANKFSPLPGTTSIGPAKAVQAKYVRLKQYVDDSNAFLTDYQTLVTYAKGLEAITNSKLPGVMTAINAIGAAKSLTQLHDTTQVAIGKLSGVVSDLNALSPPSDLKDYHAKIVSDLTDVNSGLKGIVSAIDLQSSSLLQSSAQKLQVAGTKLETDSSAADLTNKLQHDSSLHTSIVNLGKAKPLAD